LQFVPERPNLVFRIRREQKIALQTVEPPRRCGTQVAIDKADTKVVNQNVSIETVKFGFDYVGVNGQLADSAVAIVSGREQTIFRERLLNDSPKTLQEIGEAYGISRERARQLEKRLTTKLKAYLTAELGDAVQIAMGLED